MIKIDRKGKANKFRQYEKDAEKIGRARRHWVKSKYPENSEPDIKTHCVLLLGKFVLLFEPLFPGNFPERRKEHFRTLCCVCSYHGNHCMGGGNFAPEEKLASISWIYSPSILCEFFVRLAELVRALDKHPTTASDADG